MSQRHKKLIEQICEKISDNGMHNFIQELYKSVPIESLESIPLDHLRKAAKSTFLLLKKPHNNSSGWNISIDDTDVSQEYAVLEIVSKELTFLVESISNELKAQGINIALIVHPVLSVNRNDKGVMTDIGGYGKPEVVMQFHIINQFDRNFYDHLVQRIHKIIECVDLAVKDWKQMRHSMERSILEIKKDHIKKPEQAEVAEFFHWLVDNHFIFLGYVEAAPQDDKFIGVKGTELGIMKSELYRREEFPCDYEHGTTMFIKKSDTRAVVHRSTHMNCIYYKSFDEENACVHATIFIGFFTSNVYYESVRAIPFIRKKIDRILDRYGFPESSYNGKELITALESFSRTELMQAPEDDLYETATNIVSLSLMPRVKLFIRPDKTKTFISCLIFIPQSKFTPAAKEVIERILCQQLHGIISQYYMNVEENQLTRLQFIIKTSDKKKRDNVAKIEELIIDALSAWDDDLLKALKIKHPAHNARVLFNKFRDAFDIKYTSSFAAKQAVHDIRMIEEALADNLVKFDFYISAKSGKELLQLKLFSPYEELPLSSVLPMIENFGFFVVDTLTFTVKCQIGAEKKHVFIHHFRLKLLKSGAKGLTDFGKENVEKALEALWKKEIENDKFNALILQIGISHREALIFRIYAKYFKQICLPHTFTSIINVLLENVDITAKLLELFKLRFEIRKAKNSNKPEREIVQEIEKLLSAVPNLMEDRILRAYLEVILATKRTNFFQTNDDINGKNYVSLKIASSEIENMPLPKPFMEIFVYSTRFESIHLRSSKIARGGIRWSDREEDFRTEILGLMKAQATKNSVIVPGGSKGGFIIKSLNSTTNREAILQEAIACYKQFLSGILDITDNIIEGKIVAPQNVRRYDEDDPYLVVAADKGTATFSDHANEVSQKYKFWLGDAFASGGSAGYDHKKLGITARGAWISAADHLKNLGIDINNQVFTAVGIGDMSGDVFGNGLLLSKYYKLLAAFNHMHIFLDPDPDHAQSFLERKRLFELPRSQWSDYNSKLISKGGGIFNRSEKVINISPEISNALAIEEKQLTPDDLIKAILRAPVDLMWNGGIGTYVKAKHEVHSSIGDKTNDGVRINGNELRCKAVAEGGNLGFTQLGRIEFARNSGKINTDFIDNSAGVDCSDHEVNIKIACADMLHNKTIHSIKERNNLLVKMKNEVSQLVLRDNTQQSLLLTLEEYRSKERVDEHAWLMRYLEKRGELDRTVEKLPSDEEVSRIIVEYGQLSRPEIAVLISYAKNSAKRMLSKELSSEECIQRYLLSYFPKTMQKQFAPELLKHKLGNEISITVLVNSFINILGCHLFHFLIDSGGYTAFNIIKSFIVASEVLEIINVWQKIESLPSYVPFTLRIQIFLFVQRFFKRSVIWLLANYRELHNINNLLEEFKSGVADVLKLKAKGKMLEQFPFYTDCVEAVNEKKCPKDILIVLQNINSLYYAFDIIKIAQEAKSKVSEAASVYYSVARELSLDWLLHYIPTVSTSSYVESAALQNIVIDMCEQHIILAIHQLKNGNKDLMQFEQLPHYKEFINDVKRSSITNNFIPTLTIVVKRLKELVKNTRNKNV